MRDYNRFMSVKKHHFHVTGMHCRGCESTIESRIREVSGISHVRANLDRMILEVEGEFKNSEPAEIARELTEYVKDRGYTFTVSEVKKVRKLSDFKYAIPIAIIFVFAFAALQKTGVLNLVETGSGSYMTAFIVGIIASLSTCMAMVGGLVLSMSVTFAKSGERVRPQILFHVGRLISFFVLGGAIGAVGSLFSISLAANFVLGLVVGLVMLILGINLLDVFDFAKRLQLYMPKSVGGHVSNIFKFNNFYTPFLVGVATFFLPCGFTQSMQVYTLSTGSFMAGALTMFIFALGTLPVLLLISFSSFSIQNSSKAGIFFKTAGLIVIAFAIFNLLNTFVAYGLISPIFNL